MSAIEINEDHVFQERFWALERIAWGLFSLIIIAALLGLSGQGGVFARATAQAPGVSFDYPRISRLDANDNFIFRLTSPTAAAEILVDEQFLEVFDVRDVSPEPSNTAAVSSGVRLAFNVAAGTPVEVTFRVRAKRPSLARKAVFDINGERIFIRPIVLP